MGEAARKRDYKQRILEANPWCVYCGGEIPAEGIDHVPSKMMFRGKSRPLGNEVSACLACNQKSSEFEVIANTFGRISFPVAQHEDDLREFQRLLRDSEANNPGFLKEIAPERRKFDLLRRLGLPPGSGAFNTGGPIVTSAINRFAAKLGFALHYLEAGSIVPTSGGVITRWYTNKNHLDGEVPDLLFEILGPRKTIARGRFSVEDRFSYACAIADTKKMAAYFCTFQFGFATLSYVVNDLEKAVPLPGFHVFRPRFIRDEHPTEIVLEP